MSIHVYYLNPDFSCKQLLAAIILSNRLLYSGHGDKLFMFSDSSFDSENITQIIPNTISFFVDVTIHCGCKHQKIPCHLDTIAALIVIFHVNDRFTNFSLFRSY